MTTRHGIAQEKVVGRQLAAELAQHPIVRKGHVRHRSVSNFRDFPAHRSGRRRTASGRLAQSRYSPLQEDDEEGHSGEDDGQDVRHAQADAGRAPKKTLLRMSGRATGKRPSGLASVRALQGLARPQRLRRDHQAQAVAGSPGKVRRSPGRPQEEQQGTVQERQEDQGCPKITGIFQGLERILNAVGGQWQHFIHQITRPRNYAFAFNTNIPVQALIVAMYVSLLAYVAPFVRAQEQPEFTTASATLTMMMGASLTGSMASTAASSPPPSPPITTEPDVKIEDLSENIRTLLRGLHSSVIKNITGEYYYPFAFGGPAQNWDDFHPDHPTVKRNRERGCNQRLHGNITVNGTINGFRYVMGQVAIPDMPEKESLPLTVFQMLQITVDRMKAANSQLSWHPGWKKLDDWEWPPTTRLHPHQESVLHTTNLCPTPTRRPMYADGWSRWYSYLENRKTTQPTTSPRHLRKGKRGSRKILDPRSKDDRAWAPFPAAAVGPYLEEDEPDQPEDVDDYDTYDPHTQKGPTVLTADGKRFRAFDCSAPLNISAVTVQEHNLECDADQMTKMEKKKTYLLLQRANRLPIRIKRIDARYNRIVAMCGMHGHVEILFRESKYQWQYDLTKAQLIQLWNTGRFNRPSYSKSQLRNVKSNINTHTAITDAGDWEDHICQIGQHCRFDYQKYGVTANYWSGGVYCQGVTVPKAELFHAHKAAGDLADGLVTYYLDIMMTEEDAYFTLETGNRTTILIDKEKEILPPECTLETGFCRTDTAYYMWNPPTSMERCPLFLVRQTEGVDMQLEDARRVTYLSEDSSMIRLEKAGPAIPMCESIVQPTVVNSLLLSEDMNHPAFTRSLHPSEASPYLYSSIGDYYIYEKTQDDIERAVLGLQQHQCQNNKALKHQQIAQRAAQQSALADGETAHLQGAQFFTARGDAGYTYNCRPVIVTATVPDGKCYDALPVQMIQEDEDIYRQIHGLSENDTIPMYFMESGTHRLSPTASEVRCVDALAPLYRNIYGYWVAATSNGLRLSVSPKDLGRIVTKFYEYARGQIGAPGEGMYDRTFQQEIADFLFTRNAFEGLMNRMMSTSKERNGGSWPTPTTPFSLSNYYPDSPSAPALQVFNELNWAWMALASLGHLATGLLIAMAGWKLFAYLLGVVVRLCSIPTTPSPCAHLMKALFPGLADFLSVGYYRPNAPEGPLTAIIKALCSGRELPTPDGSVENVHLYNFHQERTRRRNRLERRELRAISAQEMRSMQATDDRRQRGAHTSDDESGGEGHRRHHPRRSAFLNFCRRALGHDWYPHDQLDEMRQNESDQDQPRPIIRNRGNLPNPQGPRRGVRFQEGEALMDDPDRIDRADEDAGAGRQRRGSL
jgi:hypothetical protein